MTQSKTARLLLALAAIGVLALVVVGLLRTYESTPMLPGPFMFQQQTGITQM